MALTGVAIAVGSAVALWWAEKSSSKVRGTQSIADYFRSRNVARWSSRRYETTESSTAVGCATASVSASVDEDLSAAGTVPRSVRNDRVPAYVRRVVGELKLRYPYDTLQMSVADKLSVQAAVRDIFRRDNLRLKDQIAVMGVIVAMVFTPSDEEIESQSILQSREVALRKTQFSASTRDHWLDTLLGRERRVGFARH